MSQKFFFWIDGSTTSILGFSSGTLSNRSLQVLSVVLTSSFVYSIYDFNRAELYFCFKTIPFELSNDGKPFLFSPLTVYGPTHLYENFAPFRPFYHVSVCFQQYLSLTLRFVEDKCPRSKSRFCFSCAFLCFSQQLRECLL